MAQQKRLAEIVVRKDFDVNQAISDIKFYWNLARQNNEALVIEIWKLNKEKPQCLNTS